MAGFLYGNNLPIKQRNVSEMILYQKTATLAGGIVSTLATGVPSVIVPKHTGQTLISVLGIFLLIIANLYLPSQNL
jgi:hypothetical protein